MPRRARVSKRREANPLDVAIALAVADVRGCGAIPEDVTLDDLRRMFERVPSPAVATCWRHLAFVLAVERPCEELEVFDPFEGSTESAGLSCGDRCRFAGGKV